MNESIKVIQLDRKRIINQMGPAETILRKAHLDLDVMSINDSIDGKFLFLASIHILNPDSSIKSDNGIAYVWADSPDHAEDIVYSGFPETTERTIEVFALKLDEHGELPMV